MNFSHVESNFLNPGVSDHSPILLKCDFADQHKQLHPRSFRLYNTVLHHPVFKGIMKGVWRREFRGIAMSRTWVKLKRLKEALRYLNTYMASYRQKLTQAKQKLEIIQSSISLQPLCHPLIDHKKEALLEVEKWRNFEEQVLR